MLIPFPQEEPSQDTFQHKASKVKKLLSDDSSAIELHDFAIAEAKRFLAKANSDEFHSIGPFSKDKLLQRISGYEEAVMDLCAITACVSYWARPIHKQILQKILSRSADPPDRQGGLVTWGRLRW